MRNETTPKEHKLWLGKHKRTKKIKRMSSRFAENLQKVPQSNGVDKTCVRHLAMLRDFVLHGSLNGSNGEFRRTFKRFENGFHVNLVLNPLFGMLNTF
jgi:hypothetical protein